MKKNRKKIIKTIKLILFITALVFTYILSEKIVDYLLTLNVELLKRSLNIILAVIVVIFYTYKKEEA